MATKYSVLWICHSPSILFSTDHISIIDAIVISAPEYMSSYMYR